MVIYTGLIVQRTEKTVLIGKVLREPQAYGKIDEQENFHTFTLKIWPVPGHVFSTSMPYACDKGVDRTLRKLRT